MKKSRLIDRIQSDIVSKGIAYNITHLCITRKALDELIVDFQEEFYLEYEELGRPASRRDVQEYIKIPIIIDESEGDKEYSLLNKV